MTTMASKIFILNKKFHFTKNHKCDK